MNGGSIRYIVLNGYLRVCGKADKALHYADTYDILTYVFELIEDNNIDIDSIEEIVVRPYKGFTDICEYLEEKGNEIIRSLKQLNREIKELKEK